MDTSEYKIGDGRVQMRRSPKSWRMIYALLNLLKRFLLISPLIESKSAFGDGGATNAATFAVTIAIQISN